MRIQSILYRMELCFVRRRKLAKNNENINLFIIREDYARRKAEQVRMESERRSFEETTQIEPEQNDIVFEFPQQPKANEVSSTLVLQTLCEEQKVLLEEKKRLEAQRSELMHKINRALENRRRSIATLRSEIEQLKVECTFLVNIAYN